MNLRNMLSRLTWNYRKDEDSNIYKLFATLAPEIEHLKEVFEKIESWGGIENAEGSTLDLIGEDVRQERLGMNDEQYRPMLRFRSSINRSNTDINSVNTALSAITEGSFIRLHEAYDYDGILEPAAIVAELRSISPTLPFSEMERIIAAGVRLIWQKKQADKTTIYLALHERNLKKILSPPARIEQMKLSSEKYIGLHIRQLRSIASRPAVLESSTIQGRKIIGVHTRFIKVIKEG